MREHTPITILPEGLPEAARLTIRTRPAGFGGEFQNADGSYPCDEGDEEWFHHGRQEGAAGPSREDDTALIITGAFQSDTDRRNAREWIAGNICDEDDDYPPSEAIGEAAAVVARKLIERGTISFDGRKWACPEPAFVVIESSSSIAAEAFRGRTFEKAYLDAHRKTFNDIRRLPFYRVASDAECADAAITLGLITAPEDAAQ